MQSAEQDKRQAVVRGLLRWFSKNRREFPWRQTFDTPDPYVILFTEIMLQRTKAEQVVPIYREFLKKYPTFHKIRTASDAEILSLFSRLGLKWRARKVVELIHSLESQYDGVVPSDLGKLKELPGVGDYAARAVLCYAFAEKVAPIDANVVRLISRLFGFPGKPDTGRRNRKIAELTTSLIPKRLSQDFNLSLLDFAALVCKPKPLCHSCPLSEHCSYYARISGEVRPNS